MPGGESTTMTLGIEREGLADPLRELVAHRHAGARHLRRDDHARPRAPRPAGLRAARATRSAARSAPSRPTCDIPGIDGPPVRAVFIRAPWIAEHGDGVEILAAVDGHPVAARQDNMLVISFHPEIAGERRVHELFLRRSACARLSRDALLRPPRRVRGERRPTATAARARRTRDRLSERGWEQARGLGRAAARARGSRRSWRARCGRAQETAQGDRRGARPADRDRRGPVRGRASPTPTTPPARHAASTAHAELDADRADPTTPRRARSPSPRSSRACRARAGAPGGDRRRARSSRSATTASCTSSSGVTIFARRLRARPPARRCTGSGTPTPASRSSPRARARDGRRRRFPAGSLTTWNDRAHL